MKIVQHNDGSCDIVFNWKEILVLFRKKKLHLSPEALRHFGNTLMKIVILWNQRFDEKVLSQQTFDDTEIKTK